MSPLKATPENGNSDFSAFRYSSRGLPVWGITNCSVSGSWWIGHSVGEGGVQTESDYRTANHAAKEYNRENEDARID